MLTFQEALSFNLKKTLHNGTAMVKADGQQLVMFDEALVQRLTKYNPNQPRDSRGRFTAGGVGGNASVTPGLGSGPKGQRRYWVYDHEDNLLGTYESLSGAMRRGMKHSTTEGTKATVVDSVKQKETHTVVFEPGFNKDPIWVQDNKGRRRWTDSKQFFTGNIEKAFNTDQPRNSNGQWTSDDGSADAAQRRVDELSTRLSSLSDKSEDIYWGTQRQLDLARQELGRRQAMEKAFNPAEARDKYGKWTSDEGTGLASKDATSVHEAVGKIKDSLSAQLDKIHEKHDELESAASDAKDAEDEADKAKEELGHEDPEFEQEAIDAQQGAAEAAVNLHQAIHHLGEMTRQAASDLETTMNVMGLKRIAKNGVKKDLTAGDVHAPTALGNEGKTKAKDFLTTIGEINGARIVSVPAAPVGKEAKRKPIPEDLSDEVDTGDLDEDTVREIEEMFGVTLSKGDAPAGTKKVYIIRHGSTDLNNHGDDSQDRIRGWLDVPLNDDGRKDAQKAAKKAAKAGIKVLVTSDLKRAKETADIIGKEVGTTPIVTPKLRPWDLGKFAGKPSKEVYPQILEYVQSKPDEPVPDGESFNDFMSRAMSGLKLAVDKFGDQTGAAVTHYRNGRLYAAWDEAGQPADHSIDKDEFSKKGGPPGDLMELDVNVKRLAGNGSTVEKVDIGMDVFMRAINGDAQAIGELAQISKADGKVNATLMLQPLESDPNWARTPFPWDASVKASMRPDQVKPFLGALTDPQELPVKTVLLRTCVAMQDRVDPDKVQSMIDNEPDDLPVVARLGANGNDTRNVIIDGHHRMTARHLMGRKTAQVRFIDLTTPAKANAEAKEEAAGSSSDK